MKIYDNKFAPSPRRLRFFLAEKGIKVPMTQVDIQAGENLRPEFLAINALGELPVLELDDGSRLTESLAICRYFEALHPEPNLLGRDAREQAQIEMWTLRLMWRLYIPLTQVFRNTHRFWAGRIEQVPEFGELARKAALLEIGRLDQRLATARYVAGDRFTMADIVALTSVDFGKPSDVRIAESQKNLARWHAEIAARPAARE